MSGFKSLFHVSLHVADAKRSIAFYESIGLKHMFSLTEGGEDDEPWVAYMRVAHGQYIEIQSVNAKTPADIPKQPDRSVNYSFNQPVWHFALETENLEETINDLVSKGIEVWTGPDKTKRVYSIDDAIRGGDGCKIAWICDPDGTPIELMEQEGETLQRKYDRS